MISTNCLIKKACNYWPNANKPSRVAFYITCSTYTNILVPTLVYIIYNVLVYAVIGLFSNLNMWLIENHKHAQSVFLEHEIPIILLKRYSCITICNLLIIFKTQPIWKEIWKIGQKVNHVNTTRLVETIYYYITHPLDPTLLPKLVTSLPKTQVLSSGN